MYIYPDIFVEIVSGELKLSFKDSISNIHANKYYLSLLDGDIDDETRDYLKKKLTRTMLIIESINKKVQQLLIEIVELFSSHCFQCLNEHVFGF